MRRAARHLARGEVLGRAPRLRRVAVELLRRLVVEPGRGGEGLRPLRRRLPAILPWALLEAARR